MQTLFATQDGAEGLVVGVESQDTAEVLVSDHLGNLPKTLS